MADGYQVKVRPEKVEAVNAIRAELDESQAALITEYRGLSVNDLKALRTRLQESDTSYRVTKNTLVRLAADDLGLGEIAAVLEGPTAIAYVKGDPIAAAKVLATFAREHPALVIKGAVLEGVVLSDEQAKGLANVDPLDVSRAKIMGLLTAPLQQLMMLLEAPAARILFVLEEIGKRGGEPEASAAPDPQAETPTEAPADSSDATVEAGDTPAGGEAPEEQQAETNEEAKEEAKEEEGE